MRCHIRKIKGVANASRDIIIGSSAIRNRHIGSYTQARKVERSGVSHRTTVIRNGGGEGGVTLLVDGKAAGRIISSSLFTNNDNVASASR